MSQLGKFRHLLHEAVWVYLRPYWRLHALIAVGVIAAVLFETCFPLTIRFLIDGALIPHDRDKLVTALLILIGLFALAASVEPEENSNADRTPSPSRTRICIRKKPSVTSLRGISHHIRVMPAASFSTNKAAIMG